MRDTLIVLAAVVLIIGFIVSLGIVARQYSRVVTAIDVVEVEPGIKCASMVTSDGVALSCWKVNE